MSADDRKARIRALNDRFRRTGTGGMIVATTGIQAMGAAVVCDLLAAIAAFDAFSEDNDPHREHDFGTLQFRGAKVFFKIDYLDRSGQWASPDPADRAVTQRVMTIMLAEEY